MSFSVSFKSEDRILLMAKDFSSEIYSIQVSTNRYTKANNVIELDPLHFKGDNGITESKAQMVLDSVFSGLHPIIETIPARPVKSHADINNGPTVVRKIVGQAEEVRTVVERLFSLGKIDACNRSDLERYIKEIENNLALQSKITNSITTSQQDVLRSVLEPYMDSIKDQISSREAKILLNSCTELLQKNKHACEPFHFLSEEGFKNAIWVLTYDAKLKNLSFFTLDKKVQEDLMSCFYPLARILVGAGNLESTFTRFGTDQISDLEKQKEIVNDMLSY